MWSRYGFGDLSKRGAKASATRAAPMTLVLKVLSNLSFRVPALEYMPALFTNTSRRPCSLSICSAAAAIDDSSVTSSCMVDVLPLMPLAWMAELAALPFSKERLAIMT